MTSANQFPYYSNICSATYWTKTVSFAVPRVRQPSTPSLAPPPPSRKRSWEESTRSAYLRHQVSRCRDPGAAGQQGPALGLRRVQVYPDHVAMSSTIKSCATCGETLEWTLHSYCSGWLRGLLTKGLLSFDRERDHNMTGFFGFLNLGCIFGTPCPAGRLWTW